MLSSSLVFDIAVLAVLVVCAALYAGRGFLAGLLSFVGTLLAVGLALVAANAFAPAVFDNLFRPAMEERAASMIATQNITTVNELLRGLVGFFPKELIDSLAASFDSTLSTTSPDFAGRVVADLVKPMITPLIVVALCVLAFLILRGLFSVLMSLLRKVNKLPIVGTVNQALGAVMGILIGSLYVFLLLCVVWGADAAYSGTLGEHYFGRSIVYNLLSGLNIFG